MQGNGALSDCRVGQVSLRRDHRAPEDVQLIASPRSMNAVMDHRDARDRDLQQTIEQLRMQLQSNGIEPQYPPGSAYGSDIYGPSHGDTEALRSLDDLHKHIAGTARMSYVKTGGSQARSQSRGRKRSSAQLGTVEEVHMQESNGGGYFGQY